MLWTSARDLRTRPTKDKITNRCEQRLIERLRQDGALPAGGPTVRAVMSPTQVVLVNDKQRWKLPISMVVAEEGLAMGCRIGFDTHMFLPLPRAGMVSVAAAQTAAGHEFQVTHRTSGQVRLVFGSAAEVEFLAQTFGA